MDIYYHDTFRKKKDICGNCDGLCLQNNQGKYTPQSCNKTSPYYQRGYLSNLTNKKTGSINLNAIDMPDKYACGKFVNELASIEYMYIISSTFGKSLNFDILGNKSQLYVDPSIPTNSNYCNPNIKELPAKWQINIKAITNPNTCLVVIKTYNRPYYYLSANKDGIATVSLFEGSDDQVWELKSINEKKFLIKSHKYCTYLSASNTGYLKKNSGNVFLSNSSGLESYWTYFPCGNGKKTMTKISGGTYNPTRSIIDFPYTSSYTKDSKNWTGRNVWLEQFTKYWNGTYNGSISDSQYQLDYLGECNKDEKCYKDTTGNCKKKYQVVEKPLKNSVNMDVNLNKTINYMSASGTANVTADILCDRLPESTCDSITSLRTVPPNSCAIYYSGKYNEDAKYDTHYKQKKYIKYQFKTFNVKSYGANLLYGENNVNQKIFLEMLPNKSVRITISSDSNIYSFMVKK